MIKENLVLEKKEKQLQVRLMAGSPSLETTEELLLGLQAAGATGVQLVLPFSDPMAAGVLQQQAGARALAAGTTVTRTLALLEQLQPRLSLELTLVTYMNPLLTYGYEAFCQRCRQVGVSYLLVLDLPLEEREELLSISRAGGVRLLSTLAVSQPQRLARVLAQAQGRAYVTGGDRRPELNRRRVEQLVAQAGPQPRVPLLIGYGGHSLEEAVEYAQLGDGLLLEDWALELVEAGGRRAVAQVEALVAQLHQLLQQA